MSNQAAACFGMRLSEWGARTLGVTDSVVYALRSQTGRTCYRILNMIAYDKTYF
jgi:hypothetical protein